MPYWLPRLEIQRRSGVVKINRFQLVGVLLTGLIAALISYLAMPSNSLLVALMVLGLGGICGMMVALLVSEVILWVIKLVKR